MEPRMSEVVGMVHGYGYGYGYGGGSHWGSWVLMALAMVAFWGAIAVVLVMVFRHRGTPPAPAHGPPMAAPPAPPAPHSGALAILADRFAHGEIDEAEYVRRRSVIEGSG